MDFSSVLKGNRNYTFHTHTEFCDGHAPMEVMVAAALELGVEFYGFSPHSPVPIESPCNMSFESVPAYLAEVERLKDLFASKPIRLFTGMEIDYLGKDFGPSSEYFRTLPLDYTIASIHFIPNQQGEPVDVDGSFENFNRRVSDLFNRDIDYVVDTFFHHTLEMIEAGGFDILGHFDKIGINASHYAPGIEDGSHYKELVDQIVSRIIDRHLTIELNTKAHSRKLRFIPAERYLPRLVEAGVPILVNSDAHRPEGIISSRNEAFKILDRLTIQYGNQKT